MEGLEYVRLMNAYRGTKGFEVHCLLQSLSVSISTFIGNEQELVDKLSQHADFRSMLELAGPGNQSKLQSELRELIRLLHNYVASVMSLVDHSRRIAPKLFEEGQHLSIYQDRIESQFTHDPMSQFLQELRNYVLHFANPPARHVADFDPGHLKSVGIKLDCRELLRWKGWNKYSRTFINSCDRSIALAEIVPEYGEKVRALYAWFEEHVLEARKDDMDELWSKHDEWARFCQERGIPTTEEEFRQIDVP